MIRMNVKRLHLLIKDREVRNLWTFWLGSTMPARSLGGDYPNLTRLEIRLRSSFLHALNGDLVDRYQRWSGDRALRDLCLHLEQRAPPECQISIIAHTRLASADIRTLVENFPDDLGRVRHQGDRTVVFRSEWQSIHRSSVALEIEAVPGHDSRIPGPWRGQSVRTESIYEVMKWFWSLVCSHVSCIYLCWNIQVFIALQILVLASS